MSGDTLEALTDHGDALKAQGRLAEAIAVYAQAVARAPASGVAEHNLAAAQGDVARYAEAEAGCRRAFAKGLDAPETWVVLARALQGQHRMDEAEQAFRQALRRRPDMVDAHRDLAQLVWMRTEDIGLATAALDAAIAAHPADPILWFVRGKAMEYAGDLEAAYAALLNAVARRPQVAAEVAAADIAARLGKVDAALAHAGAAIRLDRESPAARSMLAQTQLAAGRPDEASKVLEPLLGAFPHDQFLLALQVTAWRLLDDPRSAPLRDYGALVRPWRLEAPPGWPGLAPYLADLAEGLTGAHAYRTHPFEQSVRHGSQQPDILKSAHPAIRAFPQTLEPAIRGHLAALGRGADPVRSRNTGQCRLKGVWSIRLRPMGFHADHVHPDGWLSSAFYVDLPPAVEGGGREGWIKFGQPGVPTRPELGPEHFVKPEPGLLVLFPSYMWHGTVPFQGPSSRLTIAFDLVPA